MKNLIITLILILISTGMAHANNVKYGYGFKNGKIYGNVKVNNKQVLKVNSKKLTNGMLSFVNISF